MTDPNDIIDSYNRYREALAQANALNKAALFEILASAGITGLTVEFDGEGDSGQIQTIEARAGDAVVPLPELSMTLQGADYSTGKLDPAESLLHEAIETLCYGYLEQEQGGWENNDGAYGDFIFDVGERSICLEFNARFTDSTLFTHSF